jgi:hypothetical protein
MSDRQAHGMYSLSTRIAEWADPLQTFLLVAFETIDYLVDAKMYI